MKTALLIALLVAANASAQTVYRCGADGRSYAQQPCAEGRAVEVGDARSDSERREGEAVAQRQTQWARALERDRQSARVVPLRAVRLDGRPTPQAARTEASSKLKDFRAVDGPTKKRSKRRAA